MKVLTAILSGLLLASCTASEAPNTEPATDPFQSAWEGAEDWSAALERFSAATSGERSRATAAMLFWPEFSDRPGLSGASRKQFSGLWAEASIDEAKHKLLTEIQAQRQADTLSRAYRTTLSVTETTSDSTRDFGLQAGEDTGCFWVIAPATRVGNRDGDAHDWQLVVGPEGTSLRITGVKAKAVTAVRCVFRLQPEPAVASVYRHGDEVTVGSWGCGLEPVALELLGDDESQLGHLFSMNR